MPVAVAETVDGLILPHNAQNMRVLKTFLTAALLTAVSLPAGAERALHYTFAGCVGRFSAEMEHAWLMDSTKAEQMEDQRATFLSLMEATMPGDDGRRLLQHRLEHKMAQSMLLTQASFGQDPRRARAAKVAARYYRVSCQQLLLDS